jgi:hypothetical protein
LQTGSSIKSLIEGTKINKFRVITTSAKNGYIFSIWYHGKKGIKHVAEKTEQKNEFIEFYLNDKTVKRLEEYITEISSLPKGIHYTTIIGDINQDLDIYLLLWEILENTPNSHKSIITTYQKENTTALQIIFKKY